MSHHDAAQTVTRPTRLTILGACVMLSASLLGVVVHQSLVFPFPSAGAPAVAKDGDHLGAPDRQVGTGVTVADGVLPDGVTVFDDAIPAVANLDPDLLSAVRLAATDAAVDGIEFVVNSGWRSAAYQEQLLREAVSQYGSADEAARWVATPTTSAHVSGEAVDIGPPEATAWLSTYGAAYGLCQIYGNEPWHYELRYSAIDSGCPQLYADPTQDPRMQQ